MRSRIDIKARLAAHITALFILAIILIYAEPPSTRMTVPVALAARESPKPPATSASAEATEQAETPKATESPKPSETPVVAESPKLPEPPVASETSVSAEATEQAETPKATEFPKPSETPVVAESPKLPEPPVASEISASAEATEQAEMPKATEFPKPSETPVVAESLKPPVASETPASAEASAAVEIGKNPEADESVPTEAAESAAVPETPTLLTPDKSEVLPQDFNQPEESGAEEAVGPEFGGRGDEPVLAPLTNAALEVLGDGVFWLGAKHDLAQVLTAVPEARLILLLAPGAEAGIDVPETARTEIIPAGMADIGVDAAERFLSRINGDSLPLAAVVLPGADGAAFFKGAYLLLTRGMDLLDVFAAILPDLEETGPTGEEIRHRLSRLRESVAE